MKKLATFLLLLTAAFALTGCARPFEIGWSPAHSPEDRGREIARAWDYEGKQLVEDIDHILLLRPVGHLTMWNVR